MMRGIVQAILLWGYYSIALVRTQQWCFSGSHYFSTFMTWDTDSDSSTVVEIPGDVEIVWGKTLNDFPDVDDYVAFSSSFERHDV